MARRLEDVAPFGLVEVRGRARGGDIRTGACVTFVDVPPGFAERYEQEVLESVWQKRARLAVADEQEQAKEPEIKEKPCER